jgi:hypothetical protein
LIFYKFETPLSLRKNEHGKIKSAYWSACKVPVTLVRVLIKLESS